MKSNSIASSAIQVAIVLFIIKILGVVKQLIIAAVCGATVETDMYFIASGVILNLCTVIFSTLSITLLSIYTDRLVKEGKDSANNLINATLRLFLPLSLMLVAIFIAFSPAIASILSPSITGSNRMVLIRYIRIMSCMFFFCCYYLIINVTLETKKIFIPGKGQSFFQNLFVVIAALCFYEKYGIESFLFAFLVAGIVQCIQITWNARKEFNFVFHVKPERKSLHKLLVLSLPLLMGNAVYEINDIVDKRIASGLGHGSVSFLSYGASINEIVTTLIISAVSSVLFSHYATWVSKGETDNIEKNLRASFEYLLLIILPVMVMCFTCSDSIVDVLYGRGNFDEFSVMKTSGVVIGYAAGFLFQAARANLIRVYYAFQNTKTPMINGTISVAANIIMSITFSRLIGVTGVALATSASMLLVTILLLPGIKDYLPGFSLRNDLGEYLKMITAAFTTGLMVHTIRMTINFGKWGTVLIIGSSVIIIYFSLVSLLRVKCIKQLLKVLLPNCKN